jgi:signal transduction histidine kinase
MERSREAYDEAITLSARLAGASDEQAAACEAVLEVISSQLGASLAGIAVVMRDFPEKSLKVITCRGLPKSRIEEPLLMCFDRVLEMDFDGDGGAWGYHLATEDRCFDFRVFGIGMCLTTALRDVDGVCGGIWLGLRDGERSLPSRRKEFVRAVSEHAAASFYAARKADERMEKSKKERDFLLGLSHDLRAPGHRALYAARDLLSEELGQLEPVQKDYLYLIERSVREQLTLLGDVLDYTKHQKGFLEAKKSCVSLEGFFNSLLEDTAHDAEKKGLFFECDALPCVALHADPSHLKRILSNLLSNAVKYTEHGGVSLQGLAESGYLRLLVADTGVGVPPEERSALFREYGRGKAGELRGGVGLGLALSKVLAELNRAKIFYYPRLDGGSVFGIEIPCEACRPGDVRAVVASFNTALVIDDDPAACRAAVRLVRNFAKRTIPASSLGEARELEEQFAPDLIVSDLYLSDGEAVDFLASVGARAAILLLSGESSERASPKLESLPRFKRLDKPTNRLCFEAAVCSLFSRDKCALPVKQVAGGGIC